MSAFLKDLSKFYGTGERNRAGQTLEEFLDGYDPYKYRTPSCTADAVIFSAREPLTKELRGIKVLLVKRSNHPSIGFWALPGGFVDMEENLEDSAKRELLEETGIGNLPMEQIAAYGNYDRDPRTRVITAAYMALIQGQEPEACAGDDAADAVWCEVKLEKAECGENAADALRCEAKPEKAECGENAADALRCEVKPEKAECGENAADALRCEVKPEKTESGEQPQRAGQKDDKETEVTIYRLSVKNQKKHLDTCALVEQKRHPGLIREESFTVKDSGLIAVDHAAIIVQALTILQSRCDLQ